MTINNNVQLPVFEEFYSIQGEGFFTGTPAYFVRLAGCDVGCHWCDSKPAWHQFPYQLTPLNDIIERILKNPSEHVVITGGEPFSYNLALLTEILSHQGKKLHVETSGTHPYSGNWFWISFSPKPWNPPLQEYYNLANELKIVIQNDDDFNWALINAKKVNSNCKLYLQPEWTSFHAIVHKIIEFIKNNPAWNLSVQVHKYLNIP